MFHINSITVPAGKTATITQTNPVQGPVSLGQRLGPQGSEYLVSIPGLGEIAIVDIGNTVPGPATWAVSINGAVNWFYEGEGQMAINVDANGNIAVSGGAASANTSMLVQGSSITLHNGWGTYTPYFNPNVFAGDANGNPVTPKNGVECHLWANVLNNGTETASAINVQFFLCIPAVDPTYPAAAHGSNSLASLASGASQLMMCSIPWIPDSSVSAHQCLVAVVSCLDCPSPSTAPGTPLEINNPQTGQHNIYISLVSKENDDTVRFLNINKANANGYLKITREPLSQNAASLKSRGIDPDTPEAPAGEKMNIVRVSDGKALGDSFEYKAGETHALCTEIQPASITPGTAALYHVQQYENGKVAGGVSQVIIHQ